tara:strand:+ start:41350 stop:42015 length:666 start_codon:yes stop_codon:yes gene_type:complete
MRAKPISNLELTRTSLFALVLFCSALSSLSSAQESDFQKSIDSSSEALIYLDVLANDCLTTLDSMENSPTACDDFMKAIDGKLMANYLEQCRTLKDWRDEYVEQTVAADLDSDTENNEEMLRRLVAIEFTCGESTLRSRTQFVFTAFNRLRSSANTGNSTSTISRQLSESRFNALENSERQRLQNALQNQQNRSLRESEQQFNNLENELIRQQIQKSTLQN